MKSLIELRSGGRAWIAEDGRPTPLGLIVSEHVDKIGFFEPTVAVVEKELLPDRIRFVLRHDEQMHQRLDEIVRGYRIGCFRIAREYNIVSPADSNPIFTSEITLDVIDP